MLYIIKAKEVLILFYTGDCDRRSLALALRDEPGLYGAKENQETGEISKLPNEKYDMKTEEM